MRVKWMIFLVVSVLSCNSSQNDLVYTLDGSNVERSQYESRAMQEFESYSKGDQTIEFIRVNNPYLMSDSSLLVIYCEEYTVYSGLFESSVEFLMPSEINSDDLVHFRIAVVEDDRLYSLQNKSVILWDTVYTHLYCVFTPDNGNTEQIQFFPQFDEVIQ